MLEYASRWGEQCAPPVVFLPGAGGTRWLWTPHAERLASTYRVVALDMPGHGTHPDASFSFDRAIEDVGDVLAETGSAVLVAHSLGGHVAVEAASAHDDRVDGLFLAGLGEPGLIKSIFQLPLSYALEAAAHSTRLRGWLDEQYGLDDDQQTPPESADTHDNVVAAARGIRSDFFHDSIATLEGYDGPTILAYGEQETERTTAEALAERVDARIQWYEGGHGVPSRKPDVFVEAVKPFLEEIHAHNATAGEQP
jgi:pimeloyl-ACP methyl ester carboxylesterase